MVHVIPESGFARTYLIEEGRRSDSQNIMVVDVGSIGAAQEVADYLDGIPRKYAEDIRFIAATHFHVDHIGGIGTLLQKCSPDTQVLFHPFVREYLAHRRELPPMQNWVTGLIPAALASLLNITKPSDFVPEVLSGQWKYCCWLWRDQKLCGHYERILSP